MAPPQFYLASKSPRRRDLLAAAGLRFELCEPGDEYVGAATEHDSEPGDPLALVRERALRKAIGARAPDPQVPVLAVDTVVDLDGRELGKPADVADAARILNLLAGRTHRVHTAHCLRVRPGEASPRVEIASATVRCGTPPAATLRAYLDSGEWRGKAGAYGIQDESQGFLQLVDGAFDTVVGLHLPIVERLLGGRSGGA